MKTSARILSTIALLVASFAYGAAPAAKPAGCTTIILVRHAEQTDPAAADPPLIDAGTARAKALASALEHSGVQAIYVTQFKRTKETAAPTAALLHVPVIEFPVDLNRPAEHAPQLAKKILAAHPGGIVLVVGHSNTVPAIVEALTNAKIRAIDRGEFDRLIVVSAGTGCNHVTQAQYGHAP
jgi:broad specificity phosphatase PhoE